MARRTDSNLSRAIVQTLDAPHAVEGITVAELTAHCRRLVPRQDITSVDVAVTLQGMEVDGLARCDTFEEHGNGCVRLWFKPTTICPGAGQPVLFDAETGTRCQVCDQRVDSARLGQLGDPGELLALNHETPATP